MNSCHNFHKLIYFEIEDCPLCEVMDETNDITEKLLNKIDSKEVKIQDQQETIEILEKIIDNQIQEKLKSDESERTNTQPSS